MGDGEHEVHQEERSVGDGAQVVQEYAPLEHPRRHYERWQHCGFAEPHDQPGDDEADHTDEHRSESVAGSEKLLTASQEIRSEGRFARLVRLDRSLVSSGTARQRMIWSCVPAEIVK